MGGDRCPLRPVEAILAFGNWVSEQQGAVHKQNVIGPVAAHQSPGIVLVRQLGDNSVERGTPLVVADNNGPWMLGVALNYVGRDEGNLLRVLTARLPDGLRDRIGKLPDTKGVAMALALSATPDELVDVPADSMDQTGSAAWWSRIRASTICCLK